MNNAKVSFSRHKGTVHAIFTGSFESILSAVESFLAEQQVTPVFKRYFLSDGLNQRHLLPASEPCACSYITQPSLNGNKLSLWLWAEKEGTTKIFIGDENQPSGTSREETIAYLTNADQTLRALGGSLADSCLRTWFMVHDIDTNYQGVVQGRNEVFAAIGLTRHTHFIASTGIGGSPVTRGSLVAFNAIADPTVTPEQITYLKGSSHLNPTAEYGVAFERGVTITYPTRRETYISGTASINNRGEVMHPGNVEAQTLRMLENIDVLLAEADMNRTDIAQMLVYLRDIADYKTVATIIDRELPGVPHILLLAPVCRPAWLVEAECIAIK